LKGKSLIKMVNILLFYKDFSVFHSQSEICWYFGERKINRNKLKISYFSKIKEAKQTSPALYTWRVNFTKNRNEITKNQESETLYSSE